MTNQGKLIVLVGAPMTGKTTWARQWVNDPAAPLVRLDASDAHAARELALDGFDVVYDPEGDTARLDLLKGLDFEVKYFPVKPALPTGTGAVIRVETGLVAERWWSSTWRIAGSGTAHTDEEIRDLINRNRGEFAVLFEGEGF